MDVGHGKCIFKAKCSAILKKLGNTGLQYGVCIEVDRVLGQQSPKSGPQGDFTN